jgi:cold shock CspA family protein
VHSSALVAAGLDTLAPGQRLEFELAQSGDGRLVALGLIALGEQFSARG